MFNKRETCKYYQRISTFAKQPNKASRNRTVNIKILNRKLNSQLNIGKGRIFDQKNKHE